MVASAEGIASHSRRSIVALVFNSYFEVAACGYLPLEADNLRRQSFSEVWRSSPLFASLRDLENLKGKCGVCEFRNLCEGCRARAFGCTGDYLAEEPFCLYTPRGYAASSSPGGEAPLVSLAASPF